MDLNMQIKKSYGNEPYDSWFSFVMPGAAAAPTLANLRGPLKGLVASISRTSAGLYVFTMVAGFTAGGEQGIFCNYVPSALANNRAVMPIQTGGDGGYSRTNRTVTVQVATLANPGVGDDGAATDSVIVSFDATNVTVSPTGGT